MEDLPIQEWNEASGWWAAVSVNVSSNSFEVSLSDFSTRKKWLRTYWVDQGRKLVIDPKISHALNDLENAMNLFVQNSKGILNRSIEYSRNDLQSRYKRKFTDFQFNNVINLMQMKSGANFSVPGSGKTSTTLVVWNELKSQSNIKKLLVVCPQSAFDTWESELEKVFFSPPNIQIYSDLEIQSDTEILVLNFEKLENEKHISRIKYWMRNFDVMLVIDEAHRIKGGSRSVRYIGCNMLSKLSARTDILTGTPLPQSLDDLRNLFSLSWNLPSSFFSDDKLKNLRNGGVYTRTTKSELGLPPVEIREVLLPMGNIQSQIYSALGRNYIGTLKLDQRDQFYFRRKGRAIFTLLAAASNPGLLMSSIGENSYLDLEWPPQIINADLELKRALSAYGKHEIPPKYIWISNMLNQTKSTKSKILIWSNFIGNLKALEVVLKPFKPELIYGAVGPDERINKLNNFRLNPECRVLLTNPQTLGEGISLHDVCHEAVYLDRSYNAGHYLQSVDRIHRLGLPSTQLTKITFLVSERTIDERVQARLQAKISNLANVLNDEGLVAGTLPNSDEDSDFNFEGIDEDDLNDLFDHLKQL